MKLSAPVYILKQQAKALARSKSVQLHVALDEIATREGFTTWSHLASTTVRQDANRVVYKSLRNGDLILVGARPGQGKTMLGAGLAVEAMTQGHCAAFFTLEYTKEEVAKLFQAIGRRPGDYPGRWLLDTSEDISAGYIIQHLGAAPPGTLVVIDYLQLLDQRRDKPGLDTQVRELRAFAHARKVMIVCLSQIARNYTQSSRKCPDLQDVRLPNPVDLSLFNKSCFIQSGKMQLNVS